MGFDDDFEDLFGEVKGLPCLAPGSPGDAASDHMLDDVCTRLVDDIDMLDIPEEPGLAEIRGANKQQNLPCDRSLGIESSSNSRSTPHAQSQQLSSCASPLKRHAINPSNGTATCRIEEVIEDIVDQLLRDEDEVKISLKRRPQSYARARSATEGVDRNCLASSRCVKFPGRNEEEAWRFTVILRILMIIHEALSNDVVLSKRDVFYRDPALFNSQSHVDRYVDDIAFTFNLPRSALNVTAAAKGLIAGCVIFNRTDGVTVDAAADREGQLVPIVRDILSADMKAAKWIIVIEKEASFRSIASSPFWDKATTEGIIITGKGYPDVATRALLHFLAHPSPRNGWSKPMIYGLADFDPDGAAILSVYKYGSVSMIHENAHLCVPDLMWLGLRSEHLSSSSSDGLHMSQGLMCLSKRDRAKAWSMLRLNRVMSAEFVRELQLMLTLNIKAELQLLDALPGSMSNLLHSVFVW